MRADAWELIRPWFKGSEASGALDDTLLSRKVAAWRRRMTNDNLLHTWASLVPENEDRVEVDNQTFAQLDAEAQ